MATSLPTRGRPRSVEADRAISEATVELLAEGGIGDLTMAGVAARAGVSTATLYRRFASKDDLIIAALEAMIDPAPPPDAGSLDADVRALLTRVVDRMSGDRGAVLRGVAGELLGHPVLREAVQQRLIVPLRASTQAVLDRALARGEIASKPPLDVAAALVLGPLHYRLLVSGEPISLQVVDALAPLLVRALGGP